MGLSALLRKNCAVLAISKIVGLHASPVSVVSRCVATSSNPFVEKHMCDGHLVSRNMLARIPVCYGSVLAGIL
eukprot:1158402-Pelagomonas_calceolata.AAC.19